MHLVCFEVFHLICDNSCFELHPSPKARIAYKELQRELNG